MRTYIGHATEYTGSVLYRALIIDTIVIYNGTSLHILIHYYNKNYTPIDAHLTKGVWPDDQSGGDFDLILLMICREADHEII